jgi:hypothetical protein
LKKRSYADLLALPARISRQKTVMALPGETIQNLVAAPKLASLQEIVFIH